MVRGAGQLGAWASGVCGPTRGPLALSIGLLYAKLAGRGPVRSTDSESGGMLPSNVPFPFRWLCGRPASEDGLGEGKRHA